VFLGAEIPHPNVGIRTATPAQSLDVNGKIRLGDDATPPVAGTMRWNSETQDFEGFDGTRWRSLTRSAGGWGTQTTTESAAMSGMHNNALGWSVAVDGDHAVIGSLDADTVYMYRRQGDAWVFHQSFAAPDDDGTSQYFGWSVAIHGAYAVIGSPQKSVNGNSAQGKAYVYHLIGDTWTFQDSLVASDGDVFWSFGWDVDLSGDYLIVGAPGAEVDGEVEQGNIYVYHRDGASWNEHGILSPASGSAGDVFGMYITIEGNEIVIGSPNTTSEGECYAFSRQGLQWTELPVITPLVGIPASSFGNSVCIEEERLFIGSRDSADFQGIVYIFEKSGGAWVETSQLPPPSQELFGFGWSLDASGDALIVGALGGAFVYRLIAGTWQKEVTLHPSDDAVGGQFGFAVGISVSGAVVAAPYLDLPSADSAGKVYFYNYQ
ncbi:MAG: hypothetical protein R3301_01795, partial [Saprospiraceae bacterium]|nr:hypothetical protein [Saprospiraceae bacterium]